MWTYKLSENRESYIPERCFDIEAIREWLRAALSTTQGELPYLSPKYGIDMMRIMNSTTPEYYLRKSLEDTCSIRDDVSLVDFSYTIEGRSIIAKASFQTNYGKLTLDALQLPTI